MQAIYQQYGIVIANAMLIPTNGMIIVIAYNIPKIIDHLSNIIIVRNNNIIKNNSYVRNI